MRGRGGWLWGLALAVPLAALLARYLCHPLHLHDPESLMFTTVGRELRHGHLLQLFAYQFNLYQGSSVFDPLLSALGFALFGDHVLAWKWSAAAYIVAIVGSGAWVLRVTSGRAAVAVFLALVAAAPFVVKDGLLMPAGGHVSCLAFTIGALALAVGAPGRPAGLGRAMAAGLLWAIGAWYTRTAVVAAPALLVAVLPGGRRAVLGLFLGSLGLPGILLLNAIGVLYWGDLDGGTHLVDLLGGMVSQILQPEQGVGPGRKFLEASFVPYHPLLFAPPNIAHAERWTAQRGLLDGAGLAWALAWMLTPAALVAGLVARREARDGAGEPRWGAAVVLLLAAGYVAGYVLSPFHVDPVLGEWRLDHPASSPGIPPPRYVVPGLVVLTLAAAWALGEGWRGRWPKLASGAVALALLLPGAWLAGVDVLRDREPEVPAGLLRPYLYPGMFGPHRGPDLEAHLACDTEDPISRANHLRSIGWFIAPAPMHLAEDPTMVAEAVVMLTEETPLRPDELPFLMQGIGQGLADQTGTSSYPAAAMLAILPDVARALEPELVRPLALGFGERAALDLQAMSPEALLALMCVELLPGEYPLCPTLGLRLFTGAPEAMHDPIGLMGGELPAETLAAPYAADLARGCGAGLATLPDVHDPDVPGLRRWPPALAEAARAGIEQVEARTRWQPGDPWLPELVP